MSFVVLAVSVAAGVFVLMNRQSVDQQVLTFLESPLTAENYKGDLTVSTGSDGAKSPLVMEAEALSLRLNPPAPKQRPVTSSKTTPKPTGQQPSTPQKPVIAKFDLLGTCVNHSQPGLSMIYINIPGEGKKWVYQGEMVGRLTIEDVKEGSVVYTDGGASNELEVTEVKSVIRSLLKSESNEISQIPVATPPATKIPPHRGRVVPPVQKQIPTRTRIPTTKKTVVKPPVLNPEQQKEQLESSLELMSKWKTGNKEGDENLAETMRKVEEMMKTTDKLETLKDTEKPKQ